MVNKLFVRDVIKQGQIYCTQGGNHHLSYSTLHPGTGVVNTTNPDLVELVEKILGKWNYRSPQTPSYTAPDVENVVVVPVLDTFRGFGTWGDDNVFNVNYSGDGFHFNNWNFVLHPSTTNPNMDPGVYNIYCLLGCILDPDGSGEYILAIKVADNYVDWTTDSINEPAITSLSTISQLINSESYSLTISAKYKSSNVKYTRNLYVENTAVLRIGYSIPKMIDALVVGNSSQNVGNTYWELSSDYQEQSYETINLLSYIDGDTGIPYNSQSQEMSFSVANSKPQTFFFDQSSTSTPSDSDLLPNVYFIPLGYITPLQYTGQQDLPDITYIADIVPAGEKYRIVAAGSDYYTTAPLEYGIGKGKVLQEAVNTLRELFKSQQIPSESDHNNFYDSEKDTWLFRADTSNAENKAIDEWTSQIIMPDNPYMLTIRAEKSSKTSKYYIAGRFFKLKKYSSSVSDDLEESLWLTKQTNGSNLNAWWLSFPISAETFISTNSLSIIQAFNKTIGSSSSEIISEIQDYYQDNGNDVDWSGIYPFGLNTNVLGLPILSSLTIDNMEAPPTIRSGYQSFSEGKGCFFISKIQVPGSKNLYPLVFPQQEFTPKNISEFNSALDYYFDVKQDLDITDNETASIINIGNYNTSDKIYSLELSYVGSKYKISYWDISNLTSLDNAFDTSSRPNASTFIISLNAWNTSSVTSMVETFKGTQNFNQPLWGWDTSKVTDFTGLFQNAHGITGPIAGSTSVDSVSDMGTSIRHWKVDESATLTDMFDGATNYTSTSQYFNSTPNYRFFNYLIRASSIPVASSNFTLDIVNGIDENGNLSIETTLQGTGLIGSPIANILLEAHKEGVIPYFANIAQVDSSHSFSKPLKIGTSEVQFGVFEHTNGEYMLAVSSDVITSSNQSQEVSLYDHDKIDDADFETIQTGFTFPEDEDDAVTDDQLKLFLGPEVDIDDKTYRILSVWSPLTRSESRYTPFTDRNLKHAIRYYFGTVNSLPHGIDSNSTTVGRFSDPSTRSAIQNWDTSQLTSMKDAFNQSAAQDYNFNENLSNWDFSNVTNAQGLFKNNTSFDNGGKDPTWNTIALTNASHMFQGCSSFNRNLSNMNMSNVTTTSYMFNNATSYQGAGIGDGWDLQSCTDITSMFERASSFDQFLSSDGWGSGTRSHLKSMFKNASSFRNGLGSGFFSSFEPLYLGDTSSVSDFTSMFEGASRFDWPGRIELHLNSATTTEAMFANTPSMYSIIQGHLRTDGTETFYTGNVTNMTRMFEGSAVLEVHLNTDSVTTMEAMFKNAIGSPITKVFDLVSHVTGNSYYTWNTSNVTNFSEMFSGAKSFNGNLSSFDTSNGQDFSQMLKGATRFNQDITGLDVSSSQDMTEMLSGAKALRRNVRLWAPEPTSTTFTNMFYDSTQMIEHYRGTTGWLTGSTPTIEFFDPTETYVFKIPDGSSFSEEINYLGKGNIGVPDVGSLEKVEILSNAESHYFELTKNAHPIVRRVVIAEGTQKHCLEPQARTNQFISKGVSVLISDLDGVGLSLRSKGLLYHSTNTNYDIDLVYTFSNGKTINVHIEVDVYLRSTNCPCRVFSGTEKEAGFFSGTMNQPTFMVTNAGLLSTFVNTSRYVGTKRIVPSESATLNAFGRREGAPGGSGAPPRNTF